MLTLPKKKVTENRFQYSFVDSKGAFHAQVGNTIGSSTSSSVLGDLLQHEKKETSADALASRSAFSRIRRLAFASFAGACSASIAFSLSFSSSSLAFASSFLILARSRASPC